MLQITASAAAAIEEITHTVPGSSGVRISTMPEASTNGSGPSTVFDFYPADAPESEDEVVEEHGVQLFLEPDVVPYLEDKLLDAELTAGEVHFVVEPQGAD